MTTDYRAVWETYAASWKAATEAEKRGLFQQSLAADCVYRDPLAVAHGWDDLATYMLDFHRQIPGGHFITRSFRCHNDRSIVEWDMCAGDDTVIGNGISYGEYGSDGLLVSLNGFFDAPAAAA